LPNESDDKPNQEQQQERCRSLQTHIKELKANYSQLLQLEQEKTTTLDKECNEFVPFLYFKYFTCYYFLYVNDRSISNVVRKIDDDEREIDQKSIENEELQLKLEQFQVHLQQRRQRQVLRLIQYRKISTNRTQLFRTISAKLSCWKPDLLKPKWLKRNSSSSNTNNRPQPAKYADD